MMNPPKTQGIKIAVIGGGSTYTPELVSGFLSDQNPIPIKELWLMDIDPERLQVVGGFAQRMAAAKGDSFKVVLGMNQREAIAGASYVITQLRVGMMEVRRGDEYLGKRHGLIGQETTGIGGMAKALRTIPVLLSIARDIRATAPGALLLNFTNPAGLVTEALTRHEPEVATVGVCNVGITTQMVMMAKLRELLGIDINPEDTQLDTLGLNHLTWHRGFLLDGENQWPRLFPALLEENRQASEPEWDPGMLEMLGMIPNNYLQYYYYTSAKLKAQEGWPPSRAEQVMEIEKELLQEYADPSLITPPPGLLQRGGAFYSTLATQVIHSHYFNLGKTFIVNVPNRGAVVDMPDDWVLELPAVVKREGIKPIPTQPLPLVCSGLVARVKSFELLTVEAAVHGDRQAAWQAMLSHPLGPQADKVSVVWDDLIHTNKKWLPQFA
jgi:6-phospho-beta-glucosidase